MLGVENCKYRLGEDVYFLWQNKIFLGKIEGRHASESLRRYDVRCDVNPNNRLSFSFCEELLFTKIDDLTDYLEDEYYSRKQKEYDEKEEKSKDKWGTWFEPVESNKIPPTMINLENLAERIKGLER